MLVSDPREHLGNDTVAPRAVEAERFRRGSAGSFHQEPPQGRAHRVHPRQPEDVDDRRLQQRRTCCGSSPELRPSREPPAGGAHQAMIG